MTLAAVAAFLPASGAATLLTDPHAHTSALIHVFFSLGILGVFLVSIVDSSFVPLPVPGVTDIMVILYAAGHMNLILLVGAATAGSALGGYVSYVIAQKGGMEFLEKHVPKRIFRRVTRWMESHAILAVAIPALLPPPLPLSPFVLAAGALRMSFRRFITAFTVSRLVRHALAAWLGVFYGPQVLRIWDRFSARYGAPILIALWSLILVGVGFAFWKLYNTSRSLRSGDRPSRQPAPAS